MQMSIISTTRSVEKRTSPGRKPETAQSGHAIRWNASSAVAKTALRYSTRPGCISCFLSANQTMPLARFESHDRRWKPPFSPRPRTLPSRCGRWNINLRLFCTASIYGQPCPSGQHTEVDGNTMVLRIARGSQHLRGTKSAAIWKSGAIGRMIGSGTHLLDLLRSCIEHTLPPLHSSISYTTYGT